MNDNTSFERYVAEAFDREGSGRPVPDAIHDELLTRAGRQRQWPTWLASVKEPPMRISNSNAVGSPTIRVVAIMAATFLLILALAAAGIAGRSLLAANGTIVVDPDGEGHYTTIAEAVAEAQDGDTVLLYAGTYRESVTVTSAITIRGDEPGAAVIEVAVGCTTDTSNFETTCPPELPEHPEHGYYGFALEGADATIEGVHFHFGALANGVIVSGGSASLRGLSTSGEEAEGALMVNVDDGARITIEDSDLGQGWILPSEDSHVTVENSDFVALFANHAADSEPYIVRDSRVTGTIYFTGPMLIEGNEFPARADGWESDPHVHADGGNGWIIRDNLITGSRSSFGAIVAQPDAGPGTIEGNTLIDNDLGIAINGDPVVVSDNDIRDGEVGIQASGTAPEIRGNTVTGMSQAGVNMARGEPSLSGNQLCGSVVDLFVGLGAEPAIADDNEICVIDTIE